MSDAAKAKAHEWDQGRFSAGLVDEVSVLLDAFAATETARAERAEAQVERLRAAASRVMAIADRDHEAFVALRVLLADPPSGAPR